MKKRSLRAKKKRQVREKEAFRQKQSTPQYEPLPDVPPEPRSLRLWLFRLASAFILPAVLLIVLEMGLRAFGYGVHTGFTIRQQIDGQERILSNPYFVWRFLGPRFAATKGTHFTLPAEKTEGTYRIFVLGASAAQGFPAPDYGMARMLAVMLQEKYPDVDFEVTNAAIPAISSHVVLPIIRDCSRLQADLFVIYLGNNEVVGPYGAGTVFSPLVSHLPMIRAGVALRSTRLGQLLSNAFEGIPALGQTPLKEFHGMASFVNHQVRAADPGMPIVYRHFEKNLSDICRVAQRTGIPAIVSTVGVNLKDSPPFASLHRPGLPEEGRRQWEEFVREGEELRQQGRVEEAIKQFLKAEEIDADHAELHFRLGRCYWASGDYRAAKSRYVKAMELDALRFRADTRINEIIRNVAAGKSEEGIHLVDSLQVLEDNSPQQIPGNELFYEHVHLNFRGTYLTARTIFEQMQHLLPDWVNRSASDHNLLSEDDCAQRLVYTDWSRLGIARGLLSLMKRPPFTDQLDSVTQVESWSRKIEELEARYTSIKGRQEVLAQYEVALAGNDVHYLVHVAYAGFQYSALDNPQEAEKHLKAALRQCPQSIEELFFLSEVLSYQGKQKEARSYLSRALNLARSKETPESMEAKKSIIVRNQWKKLYEQAKALRQQRRYREGTDAARQALAVAEKAFGKGHPRVGVSLNNLASFRKAQGEYTEAESLYKRSLAIVENTLGRDHPNVAVALNNLAGIYLIRGQNAEAESLYMRSLGIIERALGKDHPNVVTVLFNLSKCAEEMGKLEAAKKYMEQVRQIRSKRK